MSGGAVPGRVLVTGGSGLLGRFVVDAVAERHEVGVLDLKRPRRADVEYHDVNVLDLEAVRTAVEGYGAVIHLAAIDDGNPFPDEDFFRTNVVGTWNVLHAAEAAGVQRAVLASSTAAYGLGTDCAPRSLPVAEDHPLAPRETYSLTKKLIESVGASFADRGALSVVCLRPTLIVRPERERAILAQLALDDPDSDPPGAAPGGEGDGPYGALSPIRGYVRSADAARCFALALGYDATPYAVFNVAADDSIGATPTLERLARAYGDAPPVGDPARYAERPAASVFDNRRAADALGWRPESDWESVVKTHA